MEKLSKFELASIFGGSDPNCEYLQDKAILHKELDNPEDEDKWWDEWAEDWLDCVSKL